MKKEAITRERDAVESEFQQSLQDDEQRRSQILASEMGNSSHPCSIFTWGNSKTLKDDIDEEKLFEELHDYRKRHYSAHRMYCCIQARLPLDELERMASKYFSKIHNNNLSGTYNGTFNEKNAFKNEFYENVIFIKPVSNIIRIDFTWCLPPLIEEYKTKPHHYLAYLFGYEGVGSLCAYLRKKLWALEMIAGVDDSGFEFNSMYSLFNVCISLTENGFENIEKVLSAMYSYIKLIANVGCSRNLFKELKTIEEIDFRYQTERCAFDNVQDLVINMKYYSAKDILTGPNLYFEYNENSINKLIELISTSKFNITVTSYLKYDGICYDKCEKWFGTEYCSMKMPQSWIDLYDNAPIMSELHFPLPNQFISTDFRIFWKEMNCPNLSVYPKKIVHSDTCELWFRQDNKFLLPEAYMYFYFITPLVLQNSKNAVLLTLYSHIVKFELVEQLYPATIASLNYQYYCSDKGIVLKVSGYNEKLHLIVDIITKTMSNINEYFTLEQLNVYKKYQQKNYFNFLMKPKSLNKDIRLKILEKIRWSVHEKYNLIESISLEDIKEFASNLFKEMKIQALIQGNLKEEAAHNVMNSVLTNLKCSKIQNIKQIESLTCQLPIGSNYVICNAVNNNDCNTVVTNFYQMGPCTLKLECLLDLLLMLVEEPLFDILRTKEQLGYDISATVRNNSGILGYSITVNSQENKFSCSFVQTRIETFRVKMMTILEDMEDEEFEHVKQSLIKTKQVSDTELKDEVSRNWSEITSEEYIFDRLKQEIECLRNITKQDIINFCLNYEKNNLRKLSVQVIGSTSSNAVSENEIEAIDNRIELKLIKNESSTIFDIEDFKKNLNVYPVTKTLIDFPN
ncbi:nardilysin isoform X2 [Condylostylus longicornis]|nr:nardilysin isoform X2 [Condylostylus longicornis]